MIQNSVKKKFGVVWWSFLSSFLGIAILALLQFQMSYYLPTGSKLTTLVASFGAVSILVFGAIEAPLAQPRNAILGNTLSAFVGVVVHYIFKSSPELEWLAAAFSVSFALVAMQITDTVHPPGGATALIAIIAGDEIHDLGFLYVIIPVFVGTCILVCVSVVVNNIQRQYPRYWLTKN